MGRNLPHQSKMDAAFSNDFQGVRVHQSRTEAANVSRALGAEAFAHGASVHFGGAAGPHDPGGRELLGHELSHVVQQSHARSDPAQPPDNGTLGHTLQTHAHHKQGR